MQLGLGTQAPTASPQFLRMLYGLVVTDVAAGGWHSMFVLKDGSIMGCGDNRYGQLGLGHLEATPLPRQCLCPATEKFVGVACGTWHTLGLTAPPSGCVWTCGWNHYGQLGLAFLEGDHESVFRPLLSFRSTQPTQVVCGSNHSMYITAGGDLWTWGRGDSGQLGHGTLAHEPEPRLVSRLSSKFWILSAAGGEHHTIACADSGGACIFLCVCV